MDTDQKVTTAIVVDPNALTETPKIPTITVDVTGAMGVGRNGHHHLTKIEVWGVENRVHLDFFGQRNQPLNAGASSIPLAAMDQLCLDWVTQRGLLKPRQGGGAA